MTSRCTCLSAWPPLHTGTQVRLNIAVLPLCLSLLPHAAPLCTTPPTPPHPHTPLFQPLIWSKLGAVARVTLSLSHLVPFYRNTMTLQWAGITNWDLLAPERWPPNIIHSDYSGDVCLYESIFGQLENSLPRVEGSCEAKVRE